MISKLDPNLPPIPDGSTRYGAFAFTWRALYEGHAASITAVDACGYPFRVRIFDRILLLIGEPAYGNSAIRRT